MEENMKIIFNGKEIKDLRNEKVSLDLEDSVERTDVDFTGIKKLPMNNSIYATMHIKKNTESYKRMQEFFKDCEAKALLETWCRLKDSNNE